MLLGSLAIESWARLILFRTVIPIGGLVQPRQHEQPFDKSILDRTAFADLRLRA